MLLRNPQRVQTIEDDRESAIHVLTWLTLRYTKHDELDNLHTYLKIYDKVDRRQSKGIATGGRAKGNQFADKLPTFTSSPLNWLLSVVRKTFSAHHGETYSEEEIQDVKNHVDGSNITNPTYLPPAYVYASRMAALMKPNWLVEAFNNHFDLDDWPSYNKAVANGLTSGMDLANKRKQEQVRLDDQVSSTNSKQRRA